MIILKNRLIRLFFAYIILLTRPVSIPPSGKTGIVTVAGHQHLSMLLFAIKNFTYVSPILLPCSIINDGTLTKSDKILIKKHIHGIAIYDPEYCYKIVMLKLNKYPHIYNFRKDMKGYFLSKKLFDTMLIPPYERFILMDCDVIFYKIPSEIILWVKNKEDRILYSTNISSSSFADELNKCWVIIFQLYIQIVNKAINPEFNSGFICMPKSLYKLERIERLIKFLSQTHILQTWAPEQFIFASLAAENPSKKLPSAYVHIYRPDDFSKLQPLQKYTFIHFAFKTKNHYYLQAIQLLFKSRLLKKQNIQK